MKILFVVSGKEGMVSPIVLNQVESLLQYDNNFKANYFIIKKGGLLGYFKSFPLLIKQIKNLKPDIIHAHYSFCGYLTGLTFQKKRIVVSLMGSDSAKKGLEVVIIKFFSRFLWGITIVKSERMKTLFDNKNMIVIPNGVNLALFKPLSKEKCQTELGYNTEKKHIVFFLSNINRKEKNLPLANKAIEMLSNKNVEFHVINYIEKEKIPTILNASDVLLLTSYYEGSPNIVKEAMACSIPIVTTDVGDVNNTIGKTEGCFITSFQPKEIKDAIEKALNFGKRTNGHSNIGFLDSKVIAKKLFKLYKELLK